MGYLELGSLSVLLIEAEQLEKEDEPGEWLSLAGLEGHQPNELASEIMRMKML